MALALNLVALLLVLAFVWVAMVATSGYFHRRQRRERQPDGEMAMEPDSPTREDPCPRCGGVGAHHRRGSLTPCDSCEGTGVLI